MCIYCERIRKLSKDEQLEYIMDNPELRPIVKFSDIPKEKEHIIGMPLQIVVRGLSEYADFYCPLCGDMMTTDSAEVRRLRKENETMKIRMAFEKQYAETHRRGRPLKGAEWLKGERKLCETA